MLRIDEPDFAVTRSTGLVAGAATLWLGPAWAILMMGLSFGLGHVVAQAIVSQMEKTRHPNVYLDVSHLDPQFVRDRIRSAIDNLAEPRIFVNDLLQGRANAAGITLARFFINTTVGAGGVEVGVEEGRDPTA